MSLLQRSLEASGEQESSLDYHEVLCEAMEELVPRAPRGYSSVIARPGGNRGEGGGFRRESEDCWVDKTGESLP